MNGFDPTGVPSRHEWRGSASESTSWTRIVSPSGWFRIVVAVVLLAIAYRHALLQTLVGRWLSDGDWSHGWLIPLFSLYFLGTRRDELAKARVRPSYMGAIVLAVSLAGYFVSGWVYRMAYPQAVTIVGAIFGLTLLMGGWRVIRVAWFPIVFLLLAVPLPQRTYVAMTMPMRQIASSVAAAVMPLFASGLHTEAQAVVIDYVMPGMTPGTLNIEEACAGMRLTMAFVTLGVAMAYLGERPAWQRLVMVASCVPIAILCNAIRVTTTGLLYVHGHQELARGTPHQLLGIVMLAIALGLFSLLGYVLNRLLIDMPDEDAAEQA